MGWRHRVGARKGRKTVVLGLLGVARRLQSYKRAAGMDALFAL